MIRSISVGTETSLGQALFGSFPTELYGVLNVFVIGLTEGPGFDSVVDGENGVTLVHLGIVHDGHHRFHAAVGDVKHPAHVIFHVIASDEVRG